LQKKGVGRRSIPIGNLALAFPQTTKRIAYGEPVALKREEFNKNGPRGGEKKHGGMVGFENQDCHGPANQRGLLTKVIWN